MSFREETKWTWLQSSTRYAGQEWLHSMWLEFRVAARTPMFCLVTTPSGTYRTSYLVDMWEGGWSMKVAIYRNLMPRFKKCRALLPCSPRQLWRSTLLLCFVHYNEWGRDTSVGIVTRHWLDGRDFSLPHSVKNASRAHPDAYPVDTGGYFPWGVKLTAHLHLVPRSRMVDLYSTPPYVFMAWCLINLPNYKFISLPFTS
jgi:hypothetical protein